jgi:putative phosphoesterase
VLLDIISDTHGYFDPRLLPVFDGVEAILHAGDVGGQSVLDALAAIAPTSAVFGNNDASDTLELPERLDLEVEGCRVHVVHELPRALLPPETDVIVFGHSHKPLCERREGLLYLNPGAAGRRGFHRVQTVALLRIEDGRSGADLAELGPRQRLVGKHSSTE